MILFGKGLRHEQKKTIQTMSNTLRFVFLLFFLFGGGKTMAQITTSGIRGLVADEQSEPVVGATVLATHIPSGTR